MFTIKKFCALVVAFLVLSTISARAQWIQAQRANGIVYLLFSASPRIERYSLADRQWLRAIKLPSVFGLPSAFCVDDSGLFVAYSAAVKRYDLNGDKELHILNSPTTVLNLFTDGDILFVNHTSSLYANFTSVNKTTGAVIADFQNYVDSTYGASIARSINKIFGRTRGVSPSDITFVSYNSDGTFINGGDSPHHGDYPGASRTWVFPDDAKVVDDSGTVYNTGNLTYLNSFGGKIDDIDFYGNDIPIVLRDSTLIAFSKALLPTGNEALPYTPLNIFVSGTNVLTFTPDFGQTNGVGVAAIPLADLNPPTPGQPVNPVGVPYTPDAAFVDTNSVVILFSKPQQSLFRWDTKAQKYLETIPLVGVPSYVAYSPVTHRVYTAYPSGLIQQIDLGSTNWVETPFATLAARPLGLATAGAYVFAMDASGAWGTHYVFNPDGNKISSKDWNYYSTEFIWSQPNQKMYFFRDDTSPNDVLSEVIDAGGQLGTEIDSPLHDSFGFTHPLRVSPDGSIIVLGSGLIHDASTLARLSLGLANSVNDIAWVNGELKTIRSISEFAQFQEWNEPNYGQGIVRQVPGTALKLLSSSDQLVAITAQSGIPNFYVMDNHFDIVAPNVIEAPVGLWASVASTSQVNLTWIDVAGEESYAVERKVSGETNWTELGTTSASTTSFSDGTVSLGTIYSYRVIARNGTKESAPSAETLAVMMIPLAPTNIVAKTISSSQIQLTWNDVEFETGYQIEQQVDGGSWTIVTTMPANSIGFTNVFLSPDTTYSYRIWAINGIGSSAHSAVVSATTDAIVPQAPFLFTANALNSFSAQLGWFNVGYEDSYVVERRLANGSWNLLSSVGRDVVSFTDNSAQPATSYEYRVYATNRAGASPYSNVRAVTTPALPPPATPSNLVAKTMSGTSIQLTWNDVQGEKGYRLQQRADESASWTTVASVDVNATVATASNLVTGLRYFFRVQAFNDVGESAYSNEASAVTFDIVNLVEDNFDPGIHGEMWSAVLGGVVTNGPAGFPGNNTLWFGKAGARAATTVPVDTTMGATIQFTIRAGNSAVDGDAFWNDSEAGETVALEYSEDGGASWNTVQVLNTAYPGLTNWTVFSIAAPTGALSSATQFRWRQQMHSGAGFDTWALDDVKIMGAKPSIPAKPGFILASEISSTAVAIYWSEAPGASAYIVERKRGTNEWETIAKIPAGESYFTDATALPATSYGYRIQAMNAGGISGPTVVAGATTWTQQQQWSFDNFGDSVAVSAAEMQSPGADGVPLLLKFAFNLGATDAMCALTSDSSAGCPAIHLDEHTGTVTVEFVRRKASANPGIAYEVQISDTLTGWSPASDAAEVISMDSTWERVRIQNRVSGNHTRFCRVVVTP